MKFPLPKLFRWILRRFFIFVLISFLIGITCFYIFFENYNIFSFIFVFFVGFVFSSLIFIFLLIRLSYALSRVFIRVQDINKGKSILDTKEDPYLDVEPGEFHELNKNLNQIHNYLKWQKKIISQESSELEAVISALTGAILAIDQTQKVLFFNNQATLLFSSQRRVHKQDLFLSEIIRNPDILQTYTECLKKRAVIKKTVSISILDMDEEPSLYEITVAPLKADKNEIQGAIGLFYDITNLRKTEKAQVDFISNASHELRTPLTAIQGYVETLLVEIETNSKDQTKQFLTIIQRNVKRLVSLLNHFLELSQMEDSVKLKKDTLDTEEITKSIVKDLHIKDHKIKMDFSQKTVKADRHFLKQILYNLIDNASKYIPQDRLIEIIWTKEKGFVVLKVRDHGEGISGRHKSRLFERFYRADPARTKIKGAGIGLSIVKQLVEKHKGRVKVQSVAQKGSTFTCTFPD